MLVLTTTPSVCVKVRGFFPLLLVSTIKAVAVSQSEGCSLARTLPLLVASYGDEGRVLPRVCSVQSLERLASVEGLLLPLFNTAQVVNILIVEIVIGDNLCKI